MNRIVKERLPPNSVTIKQPNYTTTVKRIKETKASKMIRAHTAINQQTQTNWLYLKKKTMKFTQTLEACPAKPHEVWTLYKTILIPSIGYSFSAHTLDIL
eukprot:9765467-Ditylum_brightwellii.AAC.1